MCESKTQKSRSNYLLWGIANVLLPIILGGLLYYLMCPDVAFVKLIEEKTGMNIHPLSTFANTIIGKIIRNYLFDFIWAYALTHMVYLVTKESKHVITLCFVTSIVLGTLLELLQLTTFAQGTFDLLDIAVEIVAITIGTQTIRLHKRRILNEETNKVCRTNYCSNTVCNNGTR